MKLVQKFSLAVLGLLAASVLLVGAFFVSSYRNLRGETYRWFDESARNLASTIGGQARESVAYFDYAAIDRALAARLKQDPNLLYGAVSYGKDLKEMREAGAAAKGPFRPHEVEVKDEEGKAAVRVRIHYSTAVVEEKLAALVWRIGIGAAVTLGLLLATLYALVVVLVNRPLKNLVAHARVTAEGDLTSTVQVRARDEFGDLAETLNRMTGSLREMVGKVRRAFADLESVSRDIGGVSHRIAEGSAGQSAAVGTVSSSIEQMNASIKSVVASVENLFSLAGESSSSMLEMSASVEQVAANSEGLSGAVEKASSSISEMTVSIRNVAESVDRLADLVSTTSSALTEMDSVVKEVDANAAQGHMLTQEVARTMGEEGQEGLRRAGEVMREIQGSVAGAAAVIRSLAGKSRDIGAILGVINEVNEQTNLLALNAAILAAQAGEHGRGFAVVAEEIRELSARTSSSTKEITKLIAGVQGESTNAVTAMEEGTRRVEHGVRAMEELELTLRKAVENSEKASVASRQIAQAMTEQSKGIRQISVSAQHIAEMSQEIARATREQSAGSAQIVRAAEEMRELAQQVRKATTEQAKGIKLTARASEESSRLSQRVLEASREEARGSELVVRNIGAIEEITVTNAEAVKKLDEMVNVLGAQAQLLRQEIGRFRLEGQAGGQA